MDYASEYRTMMNDLLKTMMKFRGYTGSKEHMDVLDNCFESGKKIYTSRGNLPEEVINQSFGLVREMIIRRQKSKQTISYMEKCIAAEKEYINSMELEQNTIQGMINLVNMYDEGKKKNGSCTDELWEALIELTHSITTELTKKLDNNEVSSQIHRDQIVQAMTSSINGIDTYEKSLKN